jgi:hypothetical protein
MTEAVPGFDLTTFAHAGWEHEVSWRSGSSRRDATGMPGGAGFSRAARRGRAGGGWPLRPCRRSRPPG